MANITLEEYPLINYALIYRKGSVTPYVCVWYPSKDDNGNIVSWAHGHYFETQDEAFEFIKVEEHEGVKQRCTNEIEIVYNEFTDVFDEAILDYICNYLDYDILIEEINKRIRR